MNEQQYEEKKLKLFYSIPIEFEDSLDFMIDFIEAKELDYKTRLIYLIEFAWKFTNAISDSKKGNKQWTSR